MNLDLIKALLLLGMCMVLFVLNKPRMDVVALLALVLLPLSGVVTVPEALAGFSDPNVILIASLFVIGDGLVRTGVTLQVGDWLMKKSGSSETRLLVLLMLAVAGLGSVMSSTGVVAVFIPVVLSLARRTNTHPGRLMMPLSLAGLISGMLTLVATPPNMVVDSALKQAGLAGFSFFSFTPVGMVILLLGVGYMLIARRWLVGRGEGRSNGPLRRGLPHLVEDYKLQKRGLRLRVGFGSSLIGRELHDFNFRREHGANVIAVERVGHFSREILNPHAHLSFHVGDILLVDFFGLEDEEKFQKHFHLERLPLRGRYFIDSSREVGMAEIMITPESTLLDKSVLALKFRSQHGVNVVGLRRKGQPVEAGILDEKLRMGDILLVAGPWKAIRTLQAQRRDFIVLNLPVEIDEVAPALSQAPYAVASLFAMVVMMVSGVVPNVMAALITCLLMGMFRCITMSGAYKSIHWQSLLVIVGMIPFAHALQSTGGVELAVQSLMRVMGGASAHVLLAGVFCLTAFIGLFISNTATAVLMAPLALTMAQHMGASPVPFAMTVAIAASASFMTPVSSPVNTLVLGPGQYKFGDFVKVGVPFTLLVLILTTLMVPWLFPL